MFLIESNVSFLKSVDCKEFAAIGESALKKNHSNKDCKFGSPFEDLA
jgi:hypothetical protein